MLLLDYPDVMAFSIGGRIRERRDDIARRFVAYAADGTTVTETLVYGAAENTAADKRAAAAAAAAARETARTAVKAIVTDLQAEKTRADVVIAKSNAQITGADTKDVARAAKRIADAAIDLARFVQDR